MKLTIPRREHIHRTEAADPINWYYTWGARSFFLHRLRMALALFDAPRYAKLLDVGFGSGIFLPELAKHCQELHGIDVHPNRHLVEEMLRKEGVSAILTDASATSLPYPDETFDAVVSISVLEHIREIDAAMREIRRVTKPNGAVILGFPVENAISELALRFAYLWLPNAKLKDEHVTDHRAILQAAQAHLHVEQTRHFPAIVPLNVSLYCVCRGRKR